MRRRDRESYIKQRVAEMSDSPSPKKTTSANRNTNIPEQPTPRRTAAQKARPIISEPPTPPRTKRTQQLPPSPPLVTFPHISSDDEDIEPIRLSRPRQSTRMFEIPRAVQPNTDKWVPGRTTRTATVNKNGAPIAKEEVEEGNLYPMTYVAHRQFEDAREARETMERMHRRSERNAYKDRESERTTVAQLRNAHENRLYADRARQRLADERMQLESQRREYNDRQQERMKELIGQKQLMRQRSEEMRHERDLEFQRERAKYEAQRRMLQEEREEREYEREQQRLERAEQRELAMMEYRDRNQQRNTDRELQLAPIQMAYDEKDKQRKHVENMARLDRVEQLSSVRERELDNAQRRRFNELDFHDARVGRHEQYVNLKKEQRALNHMAKLQYVFDEMLMGDPYDRDLNVRDISQPVRILERIGTKCYVHSILMTGVKEIDRQKCNQPKVVFKDGTVLNLERFEDGYIIRDEKLDTCVYLIHVYKCSHNMQWEEKHSYCNIQ